MDKVKEIISNFGGFGEQSGGYSNSQGMMASRNGMMNRWSAAVTSTGTVLETVVDMLDWDPMDNAGGGSYGNKLFAYTTSSGHPKIYRMTNENVWSLFHTSANTSSDYSGGIVVGSFLGKERIVWCDNLGIGDAYYNSATWMYSDRTIDKTSVNCTFYNSTYIGYRPMAVYQGLILIQDGNTIASMSMGDGLWQNQAITFPKGYTPVGVSAGAAGCLAAYNFENTGKLCLLGMSGSTTSDVLANGVITPQLTVNERIQSICTYNGLWYVICDKNIYQTNGYSIQRFIKPLTPLISRNIWKTTPYGSVCVNGKILIANQNYYGGEFRSGNYILDIESGLLSYLPNNYGDQTNTTYSCVSYSVANENFYSAYADSTGKKVDKISNNAGNNAYYISQLVDTTYLAYKTIDSVILSTSGNPYDIGTSALTGTIDVKVASSNRYQYSQVDTNSNIGSNQNYFYVSGDITSYVENGDEVTFISQAVVIINSDYCNKAYEITSISYDAVHTETRIELDSPISAIYSSGSRVSITPFKKIGTITLYNNKRDYSITEAVSIVSNGYYIKLVINTPIEIRRIEIIYNSKNYK